MNEMKQFLFQQLQQVQAAEEVTVEHYHGLITAGVDFLKEWSDQTLVGPPLTCAEDVGMIVASVAIIHGNRVFSKDVLGTIIARDFPEIHTEINNLFN